jgi:hypothetical protein
MHNRPGKQRGEIAMEAAGIPKNLRGGIASVLFALPVIKHNYAWAGCMPAGKPQPLLDCTSLPAPVQAKLCANVSRVPTCMSTVTPNLRLCLIIQTDYQRNITVRLGKSPLIRLLQSMYLGKPYVCVIQHRHLLISADWMRRLQAHAETPQGAGSLPECNSRGHQR